MLATLTTTQNYFLEAHIDYAAVPARSIAVVVLYWVALSAGFTMYTRRQIRKNYDLPMQRLAKATKDVAGGDFSVYVKPLHTADKADYLDVMTDDFNKMVAELGSIETCSRSSKAPVGLEMSFNLIDNYLSTIAKTGAWPLR